MDTALQATTERKRGHIWDILATVEPHSFGLGISAPPPCFQVLFGKVQQCCISRDQTTRDFKSYHLQAGVCHLCPPPFLSAVDLHEKKSFFYFFLLFLRALMASSGGHVPLRPPLGPALEDSTDTLCCITDGDPWSVKQHH